MKRLYLIFALFPLLLEGLETPLPEVASVPPDETPWTTGTLLAPFAYVIPPDYINVEPFLFVTQTYGSYDQNWHARTAPKFLAVNPILFLQIGLVDRIDFQISPQIFYNRQQGASSTNVGDLPLGFDFQLLSEKKGDWWPAIKLSLVEIFPTGKYQNLNPQKNGTDSTGIGAYTTVATLVFSKLFHFKKPHFLNTYLTFEYFIPSHVHVKGFNTYGGGFGTRGTVRPGTVFITILSGELTLTKNWVLALDIQNIYGNKTSFSGRRGTNADGSLAKVGGPSFNEISLAPAIEYNWSEKFGMIAGAWFTVAGRNADQFAGGAIALNWYLQMRKK